jgi:hypothetical protein
MVVVHVRSQPFCSYSIRSVRPEKACGGRGAGLAAFFEGPSGETHCPCGRSGDTGLLHVSSGERKGESQRARGRSKW